MPTSRRDFLVTTGSALALAACGTASRSAPPAAGPVPQRQPTPGDASVNDLLLEALQAAKDAGASYADARAGRYRRQNIATRERQVTNVSDTESYGVGVRALVNGSWGFAGTSDVSRAGVQAAAREAARIARAARAVQKRPIVLAPVKAVTGSWRTPVQVDPLEVPIEEKVAMLLKANEAALKVPGIRFVNSGLALLREEKTLATTDGTLVSQTFYRVGPQFTATAIADGDFQSYTEELAPRGSGWEYVTSLDMPGNAERWAALAAEKLTAKSVEVGRYDLILDPRNLWLTIHESIGHPTELDRAMGYEANYAGTSFVAPPEKMLGQLKYGPAFMNIQGDRSQPGGLATIGYDDDGVKPDEFLIIKKGVLNDYQTTREQAAWLKWWYDKQGQPTRSHGNAYAQSWNSVQFQRMPNVSLLPGEKEQGWDDLIAATDRGIAIVGDGSFSIDQQRYNAQFGGQTFYEIRGGKITGMLKDVAYQMRTPDFWNAMDMIGGKRSYELGGSFFDGKGQPSQSNGVSHGSPPARFRNINVINTGRKA
jgi:TldD protein